ISGLLGKRLIIGSMSAIKTALPRMREATAIETEEDGASPVPSSIKTRINMTICSATKKKIVGGSSAKNSSLSLLDRLVMELNCHESYRIHGCCCRTWLGRMRRAFHDAAAVTTQLAVANVVHKHKDNIGLFGVGGRRGFREREKSHAGGK